MKAIHSMLLAKALLPVLAAFSLTGCWNPFSKAEESAPAVQSPAPPQVQVDPITIYAKLDADVRIRLDEEVRELIEQNPDLF